MRKRNLTDGWEFCWTEYAAVERGPLSDAEAGNAAWYPATVPGNAQEDLYKLGQVEDPFFADNADHLRWCEEVDFWYRCSFRTPEIGIDERLILDFGGLDTFATIWLDGIQIGRHENMFTPLSIDINGQLQTGRDAGLLIRFGAPAFESRYNERDPNSHPPPQRTRTRRAQITYGWDIGPRLLATGPWRPVTLSSVRGGRIRYSGARTVSAATDAAELEFVATVEWFDRPVAGTVTFRWDGGEVSVDAVLRTGPNDITAKTVIHGSELWWPNGMGPQILHNLNTDLTVAGRQIGSREDSFGICRVDLVEKPRPDGAQGFRFTVNGSDYFAKGMNWTPNEVFFGSLSAERTEKLVRLAAEANINMLRVWGGGIYEDSAFWDACDRFGILVWQDFMFACSLYPQDTPFLSNVTREAESVVRAFRGHVSLAAWCGDNEIDTLCGPESGTVISRKTLKDVVTRLDSDRPYVVSSPFSEPGRHPNDPESGDCHMWRHTIRHDDPFYTRKSANFVSEIGRISLPDRETIDLFLPEDKLWPPTGPLWYYHSSDTNRWRRYRNIADVLEGVENNGYRQPDNLDGLIEITQKIQADAYRFWIEHFGGDPQCWGLLLWNLCDIWPQISDAVISHDLRPKEAYHAVRGAYGSLDR